MGRTGYLAGSFTFTIKEIGTHGLFRDNTAGMLFATFVPVNDNYAILFPFGESLVGTHPGTDWLGAMVAWRGNVTDKDLRELPLLTVKNPHPPGRSGGYIMPVFTGYRAGKTPRAPGLIKIKT